MKLLLLFMALAMSHVLVYSQDSDLWESMEVTILNTNSEYRDALNFGVQTYISRLIRHPNRPPPNYYLEDVLSVRRKEDSIQGVISYIFVVALGNDQGWETIISFHVFKFNFGHRYILDDEEPEPPVEIWEAVDKAELETNQDLREILNYGIQEVLTELGQVPEDYHQREIHSIKRQSDDDGGMNYRFNVNLRNDQGGNVHVIFVVNSPLEGEKEVTSHLLLEIREGATSR